jgi:hypothetical protein
VTEPQFPVVITTRAAKHIEETDRWWRANRPAAADAILYYRLAPRRREIQVLALWHMQRGLGPKV